MSEHAGMRICHVSWLVFVMCLHSESCSSHSSTAFCQIIFPSQCVHRTRPWPFPKGKLSRLALSLTACSSGKRDSSCFSCLDCEPCLSCLDSEPRLLAEACLTHRRLSLELSLVSSSHIHSFHARPLCSSPKLQAPRENTSQFCQSLLSSSMYPATLPSTASSSQLRAFKENWMHDCVRA